ncbi:EthD domain-containing protein [Vibrio alginolyticus]|nr:EthD domain-containing protein [Vibrio alginolyticus]
MRKHVTILLSCLLSITAFPNLAESISSPVSEKSDTNKGIVFFKKAKDISYDEFLHQWRDIHYPMVHLFNFDGYVQNSKLPHQPDNMRSPYDGVLTVWFDSEDAKEKTYSSPFWPVVTKHEPLLLQSDSLLSLSVDEYIVLDGPIEQGGDYVKLIISSKKKASVSAEKLKSYWLSQHAFDVVSLMSKNEGLIRYTISLVNGLSVQQASYEDAENSSYAVIEELWFKNRALLRSALKSEAWHKQSRQMKPFILEQDTLIAEEFIGISPSSFNNQQD